MDSSSHLFENISAGTYWCRKIDDKGLCNYTSNEAIICIFIATLILLVLVVFFLILKIFRSHKNSDKAKNTEDNSPHSDDLDDDAKVSPKDDKQLYANFVKDISSIVLSSKAMNTLNQNDSFTQTVKPSKLNNSKFNENQKYEDNLTAYLLKNTPINTKQNSEKELDGSISINNVALPCTPRFDHKPFKSLKYVNSIENCVDEVNKLSNKPQILNECTEEGLTIHKNEYLCKKVEDILPPIAASYFDSKKDIWLNQYHGRNNIEEMDTSSQYNEQKERKNDLMMNKTSLHSNVHTMKFVSEEIQTKKDRVIKKETYDDSAYLSIEKYSEILEVFGTDSSNTSTVQRKTLDRSQKFSGILKKETAKISDFDSKRPEKWIKSSISQPAPKAIENLKPVLMVAKKICNPTIFPNENTGKMLHKSQTKVDITKDNSNDDTILATNPIKVFSENNIFELKMNLSQSEIFDFDIKENSHDSLKSHESEISNEHTTSKEKPNKKSVISKSEIILNKDASLCADRYLRMHSQETVKKVWEKKPFNKANESEEPISRKSSDSNLIKFLDLDKNEEEKTSSSKLNQEDIKSKDSIQEQKLLEIRSQFISHKFEHKCSVTNESFTDELLEIKTNQSEAMSINNENNLTIMSSTIQNSNESESLAMNENLQNTTADQSEMLININ